ncbi:MAG TPA: Gldg family protein [Bacteroidota bacterium]|nr:Gldg family protein [Bacteroidota bacterium]
MRTGRQKYLNTGLLVVVIVLVNVVALRYFTRVDLTEEKLYTLSEASKNLVGSLDDKFLVKAYYTDKMPPPYNNNRRYLQDQLDEYRAYAGGNFHYEFIDPKSSEESEQEAQRYGIPPVQVQVLKEDKFQVENAYMGLVFLYGDKQERIPVIRSTSNLEYEISSAIKKLTSKELKKVGFLVGQGQPELEQFKRLQEILARQYQVTRVEIAGGRSIPADVAVLIIAAPDRKFASWEKFLIDQFLMKGGRVAFFLNKVGITLQGQTGRPLDLDLDDMLASYGVRVSADLVRDRSCAYVTVSQQAGFMVIQNQIPFYYLPRASNFEETNPLVRGLNSVVLYFASSIDTGLARSKGLNARVLLRTSGESGRQENVFMVDPTTPVTQDMFAEKGIPLVVTVEGSFVSSFASTPVILDSTVNAPIDTASRVLTSRTLSKIAVVGDGDFMQDQYSGGNADNFLLAGNLVDWLADDIGLAQIRARNSGDRPLDEISDDARNLLKGVNLAVPPLVVILVGVVRWRWRVAARKRMELRGY